MGRVKDELTEVTIYATDTPIEVAWKISNLHKKAFGEADEFGEDIYFQAFSLENLRKIGKHLLLESEE